MAVAPSPLPVVAMIGGGQLARMTAQAAVALGQTLRVLAAAPDEPAARASADTVIGDFDNLDDLRAVSAGTAAVTFDHEQVPLDYLEKLVADGVTVAPGPHALRFAQDKLAMRQRLSELGLPVPEFVSTTDAAEITAFGEKHQWQIVVKATRGGYDGRGVWFPTGPDDLAEIVASGAPLYAEVRVTMVRELSAMVARSPFGQGATWPVVETVQRNGQCVEAVAPAPGIAPALAARAQEIALHIARELDVVGVMAVELFETADGLLINELAMRPHNSGHWSMDGAVTGQFEQHLRAVLDYPLGDTSPLRPVTVMANILGAQETPAMSLDERLHHLYAHVPEAKVHLYGKAERPDRKVGHINILGDATGSADDAAYVTALRERAALAAHWMSHAEWTDGWDPHDD